MFLFDFLSALLGTELIRNSGINKVQSCYAGYLHIHLVIAIYLHIDFNCRNLYTYNLPYRTLFRY